MRWEGALSTTHTCTHMHTHAHTWMHTHAHTCTRLIAVGATNLSQGVTLKAIVGEDAAQVGVALEVHAIHVPHLALVPVGSAEHRARAVHRRQLVCVRAHPDAGVVSEGEKVVHNLASQQTPNGGKGRGGSGAHARGKWRRSVTRRNDHSMKKTKKNKKNKKNKHGKREGEKLPSDFPNIV